MEENDSSRVCFLRKRLRGGKRSPALSVFASQIQLPRKRELYSYCPKEA